MNGELPKGWVETTFGEVLSTADVFNDGDWVETKDQDPNGEVRLTQLADVGDGVWRNRSDRRLTMQRANELRCTVLEAGDVLVARMPEPLGRACLFPGDPSPAVTVVDVCVIRARAVDARWLMWAINAPQVRSQIDARSSGTTRRRIARSKISELCVWLPPLDEQRRIAESIEEELSRLHATERGLHACHSRLRSARSSLIAAATSGPWPEATVADAVAESLVGLDRGRAVQRTTPPGAPYLRMNGISNDGHVVWDDVTFVDVSPAEASRYGLREGDLVFNTRNSVEKVGKVGVITAPPNGAVFNNNILRIRVKAAVDPRFAAIAMSSRQFRRSMRTVTRATTNIAAVYQRDLLGLPIPIPPLEEQKRIVAEVDRQLSILDSVKVAVDHALVRCAKLRRSILERAFTGRLVPQDPDDEPAEVLLERIRAERAAQAPVKKAGRRSGASKRPTDQ